MEGLTECGFGWVSPCPAIRAGDRKHDVGSSEGRGMHQGTALPTIVAVVPIVVTGGILTKSSWRSRSADWSSALPAASAAGGQGARAGPAARRGGSERPAPPGSEDRPRDVGAEDGAEAGDDLAHGGASLHRVDGQRHQIRVGTLRLRGEALEERLHARVVATPARFLEPRDLPRLHGGVYFVDGHWHGRRGLHEAVDADERLLPGRAPPRRVVGGVGDLLLEVPVLDGLDGDRKSVV